MKFTAVKKISIPTKQEALYFDQVLLKHSESDVSNKNETESVLRDPTFKYLNDNGIVAISGFSDFLDEDQVKDWFWRKRHEGRDEEKEEEKEAESLARMREDLAHLDEEDLIDVLNYIRFRKQQREIREFSLFLCEQRGLDAVPLLDNDTWMPHRAIQNIKLEAVRVILSAIPVPIENEVPWEQIIDFRNDEDARHKLIALRRWMRKVVTTASTITEIKEELDYLLHEYEKRMAIHKMQYKKGYIQALISAPIGFVTNLVKLDVDKSVDSIFSIAQTKINLLEKELDTPGREVAYIRYVAENLG